MKKNIHVLQRRNENVTEAGDDGPIPMGQKGNCSAGAITCSYAMMLRLGAITWVCHDAATGRNDVWRYWLEIGPSSTACECRNGWSDKDPMENDWRLGVMSTLAGGMKVVECTRSHTSQ